MNTIHSSVLGPRHSDTIAKHLGRVHAEGRRSKVLDVGTVSSFDHSSMTQDRQCRRADLIHVKSLLLDVPHYTQMVERLAVILRPGGMLVVVESEPTYLSAAGEVNYSLRQWAACVREAYAASYVDVSLPSRLVATIAGSGVFSSQVHSDEIGIPTASFMRGNSRTLATAGRMHSQVIAANMRTIVPVLLDHGYGQAEVETMIDGCLGDLCSAESRHYQRLFAVYATKMSL
ncbi:hypothetical protein BCR39DRAFT_500169 [Naematelia encephala]|uniref:Methyltransferase type 11 domain-containing protein n=1 Tax=Naematelia encephala TaxID=71784 RepID=A0A1Y2APG7_9TREE|nr:hypothetical protein BCR39DRAFT_500169 [Naematelia encephala]